MQSPDTTSPEATPGVRVVTRTPTREEIDAETVDPYAMGWDAGEDLDEPPPCPFRDGLSAKLWRKGFSARVNEYIASVRSKGGLTAKL